ncbi:hypothetical protein R3P38DRAFT_2911053 [Favolaschia claudopus]|uniref:Uncharacterized protein n=1 Tax=Favolaschia claudopus TaxID=2862362 RepID=A0AAW0CA72_9AGAR
MFPASIAFVSTMILSLSLPFTVSPSYVSRQPTDTPGRNSSLYRSQGNWDCIPLKAGAAFEDGICNNISTKKFKSLVFASPDDECLSFPNPDCQVGEGVAHEFFLGNSDTLLDGIESFSCN